MAVLYSLHIGGLHLRYRDFQKSKIEFHIVVLMAVIMNVVLSPCTTSMTEYSINYK